MKKTLTALSLVFALGACSLLQPTSFDNVLYHDIVVLDTNVAFAHDNYCNDTMFSYGVLVSLKTQVATIREYLKHREGNKDLEEAMKLVSDDLDSFIKSYQQKAPTPAYCKAKTEILKSSLDKILDAIGGKPE